MKNLDLCLTIFEGFRWALLENRMRTQMMKHVRPSQSFSLPKFFINCCANCIIVLVYYFRLLWSNFSSKMIQNFVIDTLLTMLSTISFCRNYRRCGRNRSMPYRRYSGPYGLQKIVSTGFLLLFTCRITNLTAVSFIRRTMPCYLLVYSVKKMQLLNKSPMS